MRSKLNKFLRHLQIEKGFSHGTIEAYRLDIGKTLIPFLHQKGVAPFTIKDLAGHKSLNTTMRYVKIENKEQAEAIDRLEFGIL